MVVTAMLAACAEPPPPRSVDEFIHDPIMLEAALVRCSQNRAEMRYEAECVNAREASEQIAAREEATRTARMAAAASKAERSRLARGGMTGAWLLSVPSRLTGTELSAEEFRDSLRLRFGLVPLSLCDRCDCCGAQLTVEHALLCKTGGLALL